MNTDLHFSSFRDLTAVPFMMKEVVKPFYFFFFFSYTSLFLFTRVDITQVVVTKHRPISFHQKVYD